MKIPPRHAGAKRPTPDEIKGLERALDKAYARLRERARAEWLRHHGRKPDPGRRQSKRAHHGREQTATARPAKEQTRPRTGCSQSLASLAASSRAPKRGGLGELPNFSLTNRKGTRAV
jgi:hypothetical protein